MTAIRRTRRPGFTLVELLVVLLITVILISLTASAAFLVIGTQKSSNTETLIKKLDTVLQRQWQEVARKANEEPIPPEILNGSAMTVPPNLGLLRMAGGNEKRARVIWVKLRLKQEFPQTFAEALQPVPRVPAPGFLGGGNWLAPSDPTDPIRTLPGRPVYRGALKLLPPAALTLGSQPLIFIRPDLNPTAGPSPAVRLWAAESSPLLYLALTNARGGQQVNPEDVGPTNEGESGYYVNAATLSYFVTAKHFQDAWENPLLFYRWPVAASGEIQATSLSTGSSTKTTQGGTTQDKFRDPVDPEGLLLDPTWNNAFNFNNNAGCWAFEVMCHSIHDPSAVNPAGWPRAYYLLPTIVSAGKNGKLGFATTITARPPGPPSFPGTVPLGSVPNPMLPDGTGEDTDNIYSYRLRPGARGD